MYICEKMETMAKNRQNFTRLVIDMLNGRWLLYNAESYLPLVMAILDRRVSTEEPGSKPEAYFADAGIPASSKGRGKEEKKVLVYPVHSALTKYETCESCGTEQMAAELVRLSSDGNVAGVVLDFDSPGGSGNAVVPLTDAIAAIRATGKPVIAHCDLCASAAYWIASQCDAVFMDNELSRVGSIGAYASILDNRGADGNGAKVIEVYARESPDKNAAYREARDGKPEKMQDELSELIGVFHNAVKSGRPDLKADAPGVLTGAMFSPAKAVEVGLADGVARLDQCIDNVIARAEFNNQ